MHLRSERETTAVDVADIGAGIVVHAQLLCAVDGLGRQVRRTCLDDVVDTATTAVVKPDIYRCTFKGLAGSPGAPRAPTACLNPAHLPRVRRTRVA